MKTGWGWAIALILVVVAANAQPARAQDAALEPTAFHWLTPETRANRVAEAPVIDGKAPPDEWLAAAPCPLFAFPVALTDERTNHPIKQAWLAHDTDSLYLKADIAKGGRVEIWFDPEGRRLGSVGVLIDDDGDTTVERNGAASTGPLRLKVVVNDGVLELSVALVDIGLGPVSDRAIPFNFIAVDSDGAVSSFAEPWTETGFPGRFGILRLGGNHAAASDLRLTVSPERLRIEGFVHTPSPNATPCDLDLLVRRDGVVVSQARARLLPLTRVRDEIDLKPRGVEAGAVEVILEITEAVSGDLVSRTAMATIFVPQEVDARDELKRMTKGVDHLERNHSHYSDDQVAIKRLKSDVKAWRAKATEAAAAFKASKGENWREDADRLSALRQGMWAMGGRLDRVQIIPEPQRMGLLEKNFRFRHDAKLRCSADERVVAIAKVLQSDLVRQYGFGVSIHPSTDDKGLFIAFDQERRWRGLPYNPVGMPGGYWLQVESEVAGIVADDIAGLWNGSRTLRQLIRHAPGGRVELPGCAIADWPTLPVRAVAIDANGLQRFSTDYLALFAQRLAELKYNTLFVDFGARYEFDGLGIGKGEVTPASVAAVAEKLRTHGVEIVPVFDGFGGMDAFLTEGYRSLREDPDDASTLASLDADAEVLLTDAIERMTRGFSSGAILLGGRGGESLLWGGRRDASLDLVKDKGPDALLTRHFEMLSDLALARDRAPVFWADALLARPGVIASIDRRAMLLVEPRLPSLARCVDAGFRSLVVVEIDSARLLTTRASLDAIDEAAALAHARGADGVCVSLIENASLLAPENAWIELTYAADRLWQSKAVSRDNLFEKIGWQWWAAEAPRLVEALAYPEQPQPTTGGAANREAVENLLRMTPSAAWVWLNLGDRRGLIDEARRVFEANDRLLPEIEKLLSSGRAGNEWLLWARLQLRLRRHGALKIIALDRAVREYEAALRSAAQGPPPDAPEDADPLEECVRHLRASTENARALWHDYPFFQQEFLTAHETEGLVPEAFVWLEAAAVDARAIHDTLVRSLNSAQKGKAPDVTTGLALGRPGKGDVVERWTVGSLANARPRNPRLLRVEVTDRVANGQSAYAVWTGVGGGRARIARTSWLVSDPSKGRGARTVLKSTRRTDNVSANAPEIVVWTAPLNLKDRQVWVEGIVTGVPENATGEITLTIGPLTNDVSGE